jgi:opacity protein-like surface antigen
LGTLVHAAGLDWRINHPRRILMRSKLALSALVIASLLGATAVASAQTQPPAPGMSSEGTGAGGTDTKKMSKKSSKKSAMKSKKGAAAPGADSGAGTDTK